MKTLTQDRVRSVLHYYQESGDFVWHMPPRNHMRMLNKVAGTFDGKYLMIRVDGKKYKAHRLAWLYVHGQFPIGEIDHSNGNKTDNRLANLRLASNPQNQANRTRNRGKGTPKGVKTLPSGNYQARIRVKGRLINLGTFKTIKDAEASYLAAAKQHYGEFARAS